MALRRCRKCGGLLVGGGVRFELSEACACPGLRGTESRSFAANTSSPRHDDDESEGDTSSLDSLMADSGSGY
jgi:hypothetical protein